MAGGPWGYELLADIQGADTDWVARESGVREWVTDLVKRIGMTAYGAPAIVRFGEGQLRGLTVVQLITTSSVTAHFMDHSGDGYINIHSCREYSAGDVIEQIERVLKPTSINAVLVERQAGRAPQVRRSFSVGREPVTA